MNDAIVMGDRFIHFLVFLYISTTNLGSKLFKVHLVKLPVYSHCAPHKFQWGLRRDNCSNAKANRIYTHTPFECGFSCFNIDAITCHRVALGEIVGKLSKHSNLRVYAHQLRIQMKTVKLFGGNGW